MSDVQCGPNYYNENDPFAAAWLRELMKSGLIPDGEVDARSICDVRGSDLIGFEQCHFFAGIGGWPLALQMAGWSGSVWTGSCPCQPFSIAGKKKGTDDKRHLWPEFRRLIDERRPTVCAGEQVASKDGRQWLAGVRIDLEALGYAVGASDLCSPGIGEKEHPKIEEAVRRLRWHAERGLDGQRLRDIADELSHVIVGPPHIRQRLYWGSVNRMGIAKGNGRIGWAHDGDRRGRECPPRPSGAGDSGIADSHGRVARDREAQRGREHGFESEDTGAAGRVADSMRTGWPEGRSGAGDGPLARGGAVDERISESECDTRDPWRLAVGPSCGDEEGDTGASAELGRRGDDGGHSDPDDARSQGRRIDPGEYASECAAGSAGDDYGVRDAKGGEQWPPREPGTVQRWDGASGGSGTGADTDGDDNPTEARFTGERIDGSSIATRNDAWMPEPSGRGAFTGGTSDAGSSGWERRQDERGPNCPESTERNEEAIDHKRRGPTSWSSFIIVPCLDGKARRIERPFIPMADGISAGVVRRGSEGAPGTEGSEAATEAGRDYSPTVKEQEARIGRLRGYGNAIVPALAAEFIRAFREAVNG